jgi:hypothetical protein
MTQLQNSLKRNTFILGAHCPDDASGKAENKPPFVLLSSIALSLVKHQHEI